ncbi:hypothetical protein D3C80_1521680 [compost metagenome]
MLVFLEKQGPSDLWLLFFCLVQQKYERLQHRHDQPRHQLYIFQKIMQRVINMDERKKDHVRLPV